jgi:hypothetical protein
MPARAVPRLVLPIWRSGWRRTVHLGPVRSANPPLGQFQVLPRNFIDIGVSCSGTTSRQIIFLSTRYDQPTEAQQLRIFPQHPLR